MLEFWKTPVELSATPKPCYHPAVQTCRFAVCRRTEAVEGAMQGAAETTSVKSSAMTDAFSLPWVEKYRPSSLNDVVSHRDTVQTIRRFIERDQLPHLLFHGPAGTGKTSTAFAIARTLYGDMMARMILELNASDDRGIKIVRENIKTFARTAAVSWSSAPAPSSSAKQKLKLVILDEADQMTRDAQNALRRIMEKHVDNVRFCIICNIVNKINPAIQSRCTKFRFPPLSDADLRQRTIDIAHAEGVDLPDGGLDALVRCGQGDMRRVLNSLQSAALGHPNESLSEDIIFKGLGLPLATEIDGAFKTLASDGFNASYDSVRNLQLLKGYALHDIVQGLYSKSLTVKWPRTIPLILFPRLADIEHRLSQGSPEPTELSAVVSVFIEIRHSLQEIQQSKV